jgi:hypothetical protein
LRTLVATAQQNDDNIAALLEIHPIAWAVVNPQLANSVANWLNVAGMAEGEAVDARRD